MAQRDLLTRLVSLSIGIGTLAFGTLVTERFLGAHFSPDGHISEIGYVYALRIVSVCFGLAIIPLGLRAPIKFLHNCLLALCSTILSFGLLELGFRTRDVIVGWKAKVPTGLRASTYPGVFYENAPSFFQDGELKFNSLGMRDEERPVSADRVWAVVLGDSIEAWRAIPVLKMYPRLLEGMVNALGEHEPVQIANLAVSGYSLNQKLQTLKYRGLDLDPRVVILSYCLNDPIPAWNVVNYFAGEPPTKVWRSLEFFSLRIRRLLHQYGVDFYTQIHRQGTVSWENVVETFHEFSEIKKDHHLEIILVIFPLMIDTPVAYPWLGIHRRVASVAEQEGIHVVDLLEAFKEARFETVRADSVHPNEKGHRIAAQKVLARIVKLGLVPRDGQPSKCRLQEGLGSVFGFSCQGKAHDLS